MERDIYMTEVDFARIKELLEVRMTFREPDRAYFESLRNELDRAHILQPTAMSNDVITMNSRVRLKDMDTGQENIYSVVFPSDADIAENKISVLAPIGTAILGYRAGDTVSWQFPAGIRTVQTGDSLPAGSSRALRGVRTRVPLAQTV